MPVPQHIGAVGLPLSGQPDTTLYALRQLKCHSHAVRRASTLSAQPGGSLYRHMQVIEKRTPIGAQLSSVVLAIALGCVLVNTGQIPAESAVYAQITATLMPLAAALLLLTTPLLKPQDKSAAKSANAQSGAQTVPTAGALPAFALATVGTILGTLAAWAVVGAHLPASAGAAVAAALCASYVGGTLNFAAVVQVPPLCLLQSLQTIAATPLLQDVQMRRTCNNNNVSVHSLAGSVRS